MFSGTDVSAFCRSCIPRPTIVAYLATDYFVQGDRPLVLRIGRRSDELAALWRNLLVDRAALLTAWNPYSESRPDAENNAAQARLLEELDRLGVPCRPGYGADPTGQWPPEESVLALGIDLTAATSLGQRFGQNGFVWAAADAEPTLILLR